MAPFFAYNGAPFRPEVARGTILESAPKNRRGTICKEVPGASFFGRAGADGRAGHPFRRGTFLMKGTRGPFFGAGGAPIGSFRGVGRGTVRTLPRKGATSFKIWAGSARHHILDGAASDLFPRDGCHVRPPRNRETTGHHLGHSRPEGRRGTIRKRGPAGPSERNGATSKQP